MQVKVLLIKPDLELVHDYLLNKKLTPIFLPNISWFQKNKAYGLVKKMSKYKGGFPTFKKEIDVLNDCIKWLEKKIDKENDIPLKVSCAKQLEIYIEKLEEIEDIFKKINE